MMRSLGLGLAVLFFGAGPLAAHGAHGSTAPWDACEDQRLGASCAWTNSEADVFRGTCQSVREHLVCVRNRPIQKAPGGGEPGLAASSRRLDLVLLLPAVSSIVAAVLFTWQRARARRRAVGTPAAEP